jgi:hypothetical protein
MIMEEKLNRQDHGHERGPRFSTGFRRLSRIPSPPCVVLLCVIAAAAPGCARARASVVPGGPPLDVPAPPARVVVPLEVQAEVLEPAPLPEEPPTPPVRPRAPTRADVPARAPEVPKVAEEVPPQPPPTQPPTTLQTTPAAEQGEVERSIRATMARAAGDLNRIDYRALNADARTQYDTAKRFIEQAEEAIQARNLPFAKNLADKAAVLATQLSAR